MWEYRIGGKSFIICSHYYISIYNEDYIKEIKGPKTLSRLFLLSQLLACTIALAGKSLNKSINIRSFSEPKVQTCSTNRCLRCILHSHMTKDGGAYLGFSRVAHASLLFLPHPKIIHMEMKVGKSEMTVGKSGDDGRQIRKRL